MCHGISEILLFFFRKKCKYFLSKGNLSNKQQLKARPCLLSDPFFCPFHPEHIIYSLWHTETWLTICCCMQRCVHLCVLTLFCRTQCCSEGKLSPRPLCWQLGWWCDCQPLGGCWNFDELISSLYHRALTEITGSCEQLTVLAGSPRTHKRNWDTHKKNPRTLVNFWKQQFFLVKFCLSNADCAFPDDAPAFCSNGRHYPQLWLSISAVHSMVLGLM